MVRHANRKAEMTSTASNDVSFSDLCMKNTHSHHIHYPIIIMVRLKAAWPISEVH